MTSAMMERTNEVIAKTYKRFPVVLTRGSGCTLWDDAGKRYTDFVAGIRDVFNKSGIFFSNPSYNEKSSFLLMSIQEFQDIGCVLPHPGLKVLPLCFASCRSVFQEVVPVFNVECEDAHTGRVG